MGQVVVRQLQLHLFLLLPPGLLFVQLLLPLRNQTAVLSRVIERRLLWAPERIAGIILVWLCRSYILLLLRSSLYRFRFFISGFSGRLSLTGCKQGGRLLLATRATATCPLICLLGENDCVLVAMLCLGRLACVCYSRLLVRGEAVV